MVILDEAAKAKLDNEGGAITVDGKYLVMSQQSFDKVVGAVAIASYDAIRKNMCEAHESSMPEEEKEANGS